MSKLWLFFFPLLFLPNLGLSQRTTFGVLDMSDWLIMPFILLLLLAPSIERTEKISPVKLLLYGFLGWACLTVLAINIRYDYQDSVPVLLGCILKLAKLALYVATGILIADKLKSSKIRAQWLWSLLAAVVLLSVGLLISSKDQTTQSMDPASAYKSYNATVVSMAILCSYLAGLWIDDLGSYRWRLVAIFVLGFGISAVLYSVSFSAHGRGGWVAWIAGTGYILWKRVRKTKTFVILFLLVFSGLTAYSTLPNFQLLVDQTLSSPEEAQSSGVPGMDDGGRVTTWAHEAPKFLNAPVFGTGFYHRGGESGLWETGSHNFFLQMFLETGVVGGVLVVAILLGMWRQAGSLMSRLNRATVATRAALLTAVVGGMSGEYYYGGISVLVLFAVFAYAGSLPRAALVYSRNRVRSQFRRWRQVAL